MSAIVLHGALIAIMIAFKLLGRGMLESVWDKSLHGEYYSRGPVGAQEAVRNRADVKRRLMQREVLHFMSVFNHRQLLVVTMVLLFFREGAVGKVLGFVCVAGLLFGWVTDRYSPEEFSKKGWTLFGVRIPLPHAQFGLILIMNAIPLTMEVWDRLGGSTPG